MSVPLLVLLATAVAFAQGSVAEPCGVPLPQAVAKVNAHEILRAEVLLRLGPTMGTLSQDQRRSQCQEALHEAVQAALVRAEAGNYQVEVSPEEVESKLASFRASFPSEEAFERYLAERQVDLSFLRKVIENRLFLEKFEEHQIRSWVFSEELQQEYFEQHRAELAKDKIKVSHILVKTKEAAEKILVERNLKNRSFSELATKYSVDEKTREQGGDLGWIERGEMTPEFDRIAFSLQVFVVSKPVQIPMGYHLIFVEDRKPASEQTLEDHRVRVLRLLQEEEWALQREDWWKELKGKSNIWITPELILESERLQESEAHAGRE
jgi:foldase protein PrsA